MKAKTVNEFRESGYYPPGAEHDPNAPYNEDDSKFYTVVSLNDYGEIELIQREEIGPEDWEDIDTQTIDPYDLDKFLADKTDQDFEQMESEGEGFEIEDILDEGDDNFKLITDKGEIEVTLDELEDLV